MKSKAFDGFLEKPVNDKGFDYLSSRAMSREIDGVLRKHFDEKQKMSVATNYFAMACPIMPAFLLGAFMLLDKLDGMYDKQTIKAHEFVGENRANAQALLMASMREKAELEAKKNGLACSRPLDGLGPVKDSKKGKKKKEAEVTFDGKPSERLGGPVLLSKAQTDVHKIVKKKTELEAHLEKVSQEQDFGATCSVSAKIAMLDKALKKLGC